MSGTGAIIGTTALGIAGSLGANAANAGFSSGQTAKQRKYNEAMYSRQLADTLHYSSPAYQVQKLKEAGLNPYLAVNGGQTIQAPTALANETAKSVFNNPLESIGQLPLLKAQIENIEADTKKKNIEADGVDLDNEAKKIVNSYLDESQKQQLVKLVAETDLTEANASKVVTEIENILKNSKLTDTQADLLAKQIKIADEDLTTKRMENKYFKQFYDKGIHPNESPMMQLAILVSEALFDAKSGIDAISNAVKTGTNGVRSAWESIKEFLGIE